MNRPERREGESEFAYGFRLAMWLSDGSRLAARAAATMPVGPDGTLRISRPHPYRVDVDDARPAPAP